MIRVKNALVSGLLSLICMSLLAPSAAAKTEIKLEESSVVARVTRGARTAWFSVISDRVGYRDKITDAAFIVTDDDGDGLVTVPLGRPMPLSVWAVVDLTNGDYDVVGSSRNESRRRPLPAAAWETPGSRTALTRIHLRLSHGVVWLIRPKVGAWVSVLDDGGTSDGDAATDGQITARLEHMTSVSGSPGPPEDLQANDILIIADPFGVQVMDGRVTK